MAALCTPRMSWPLPQCPGWVAGMIFPQFDWVLHLTTVLTDCIRHGINSVNIIAPRRGDMPGLRGVLVTRTASGRGLVGVRMGGSWFFIQLHDLKKITRRYICSETEKEVKTGRKKTGQRGSDVRARCRWGFWRLVLSQGLWQLGLSKERKGLRVEVRSLLHILKIDLPSSSSYTSLDICGIILLCCLWVFQQWFTVRVIAAVKLYFRNQIFCIWSSPALTARFRFWYNHQACRRWENVMAMWQRSELCSEWLCLCLLSNLIWKN